MIKTLVSASLLVALSLPAHAIAPQTVAISLLDASVDPSMSGMTIKAAPAKVKAGRVTLEAVNQSRNLVHEVLVVPSPPEGRSLPYDPKENSVDEKKARSLGEISELEPGSHGKLTLNLRPGTYLLLCNQPGHYKSGMSTKLVVEK